MKGKQAIIWILVGVVVVALILAVSRPSGAVNKNIGNSELKELVAQGALLVDVRSPAEYALGIIPGAANVEYTQIAGPAAGWAKDKPIVVYCATGARSQTAAQTLAGMGFRKVYNLTSGIQGWSGEGGEVVAPPADAGAGAGQSGTAPSGGSAGAVTTGPKIDTGGKATLIEFYSDG